MKEEKLSVQFKVARAVVLLAVSVGLHLLAAVQQLLVQNALCLGLRQLAHIPLIQPNPLVLELLELLDIVQLHVLQVVRALLLGHLVPSLLVLLALLLQRADLERHVGPVFSHSHDVAVMVDIQRGSKCCKQFS